MMERVFLVNSNELDATQLKNILFKNADIGPFMKRYLNLSNVKLIHSSEIYSFFERTLTYDFFRINTL